MFPKKRRKSRVIKIGDIFIGGDYPIAVQSMTNTSSHDFEATVVQIKALQDAGCEIVRFAIPDEEALPIISRLKNDPEINIPLVADIHFDYKLAIASIEAGCDKIRINPGNIGSHQKVSKVIEAAASADIPVRIGVNSGSLERELLAKYGEPSPAALAESALQHIAYFEKNGFEKIIISIKSSSLVKNVEANRIIAGETDYPIHLGLTEAGDALSGATKSAAALGILLAEGIGDTIRISLTADPVKEIQVAFDLLRSLKLRDVGIEYISCPTCGRTQVDVEQISAEVKSRLQHIRAPLKVAIMGCAVNGPGEAREADIGIAGGKGEFLLFKRGETVGKIPEHQAVEKLVQEVEKLIKSE
ncbi:MAG: flavodoxin-dependent (E)-4-hydroxy-3-methylbut-2-enyl-diphosphate synthase [Acidobacteria bacterium]|nr:flavodoxin-dependent (E)-4-hydroxy-3-methylbut-2-enyl-diphosphate synthase [Acidobacteriota bacterium]